MYSYTRGELYMKKFFSLAIATLMTVGTVTSAAMPSKSVPVRRIYRIALSDVEKLQDGNQDSQDKKRSRNKKSDDNANSNSSEILILDADKTIIAEINAIEEQMKTTTSVIRKILDDKKAELKAKLKADGLTSEEKQRLKDEFRAENEYLFNELEEMQRPYMEQIKLKQRQLYKVVCERKSS